MHQNLRTAIVAGAGMEKILKCSADLITATLLHFESEERVMSEYAPLSLGVHRDLHSELIGSLEGISTDLERRSISGAMELLKFFDGRLTYHLDFEDAALERELSN
jgi:hemerythrin-like metal-binding protein